MGTVTQNVNGLDAIKKIKELAERADICLFVTALSKLPLTARPMSTQKVEENGSFWFFSEKNSDKNLEIESDNRVQLFYSNMSNQEFLSIYGTATIIQDAEKAKELWKTHAKIWFNGPDDPNLTLIQFTPDEGYYWDAENGKIVSLMKMAIGVISGKEIDGSRQGKVTV